MAQVGAQLQLFYGDVGSDPTTEIEDITDFQFPEQTAADIKNTHYNTPGMTHDYLPGYTEGGEVGVTKDFGKADETTVGGLYRIRKSWKAKINGDEDGDWQWDGYINKKGVTLPVDDKLSSKFAVKVCSPMVWTAAGA